MTTEECRDWLVAWLERRGSRVPGDAQSIEALDYIDARLLDSLGVVDLITEIESEFGIAFDYDRMREPRFSTIGGLAQIVFELRQEQTSGIAL